MRRRPRQIEMAFRTWGGKRRGAGRKPAGGKPLSSRRKRPALLSRYPVLVTLRVREDVCSLRTKRAYQVIRQVFVAGCNVDGFRVTQFSIQKNHLHLIAEAQDEAHLSRGMQGLSIRIARALNREMTRRGKVFADRYHARVLKTPREVRNAVAYVANNFRHHTARVGLPLDYVDPCSSWAYFDGWRERIGRRQAAARVGDAPVAPPRTWLLRTGWRRHGLVSIAEIPGRIEREELIS